MDVELCMNCSRRNGVSSEWKKGWPLRMGGLARLCDDCGAAYANSTFCEKFHPHLDGWRKCIHCYKLIHCGCAASRPLFEYLDFGGISCVYCLTASQLPLARRWGTENSNGSLRSTENKANNRPSERTDGRLMVDGAARGETMLASRIVESSEPRHWLQAQRDGINSSIGPRIQENRRFPNVIWPVSHSLPFPTLQNNNPTWETRSMHTGHSPVDTSMGTLLGNSIMPSTSESVKGILEGNALSSPFLQGQVPLPIFPSSLMNGIIMNLEPNKSVIPQERIARPPADGRARNMLLSRYWPRITDQELEQLSQQLKSAVVPLFEKVLSASDAGRIGRLVIPKSCAEAYFPQVSQPEGVPLQILDVNGNEWTFQFRFWPNNNSRMYVLEGVTPCMQSFQLNPGDIVTFNRLSPGGKFVLGYRKASVSTDTLDVSASTSASASPRCDDLSTKEVTPFGATANQNQGSSVSDLPQTSKGKGKLHLDGCSEHGLLSAGTADCLQTKNPEMINNDLLQQQQPISASEAATQNIGPKRFLMHDEDDSMQIRARWEEAQKLLRPPPNVKPSIEIIEDQEFEEYEEPPVFGRRTATANESGKLNAALKQLEKMLLTDNKGSELIEKPDTTEEPFVGLNKLASAAISNEDVNPANSSLGATSKHPRHRDGCSCIVCNQPSSGKGKHKASCTCSACMTAKRRGNTIPKRKRKRRSGSTQRGQVLDNDEVSLNSGGIEMYGPGSGQLDLNCDPNPDDEDMPVDV